MGIGFCHAFPNSLVIFQILNFKSQLKGKYKHRVSNKEEYKKRLNHFERIGFLIEIDKCSIKMIFQPKLY